MSKLVPVLAACVLGIACFGCPREDKTTRTISVEGPDKKSEIKIETRTTEKDDD
jgi:hypothetical protein